MSSPSFSAANGSPLDHEPPGSSAPPLRVERPWGWFETLVYAPPASPPDRGGAYAVKRLWISPRCRISLQRHNHRSEHWVVVSGHGELECGDEPIAAQPGTTLFVPVGAIHRASAGAEGLLIVEVQRGDELREDDIERVEDDYGRVVSCQHNL
jgi:mannose-6-phosphate isomerase